jgi:hypothetical protein
MLKDAAVRAAEMGERLGSTDKDFSLRIGADDGSTMLETDVDCIHQAFRRLINRSFEEVGQDVCAVITCRNGGGGKI